MTDRPRVWTLHESGGVVWNPGLPSRVSSGVRKFRAVEWDREKVVPIIADVLRTYGSQREAEAIFDALDREG